jgi:hypothetical protein
VGGRILYTDEKTSYVFIGNLLDTRTTLSAPRRAQRELTVDVLSKSTASAIARARQRQAHDLHDGGPQLRLLRPSTRSWRS